MKLNYKSKTYPVSGGWFEIETKTDEYGYNVLLLITVFLPGIQGGGLQNKIEFRDVYFIFGDSFENCLNQNYLNQNGKITRYVERIEFVYDPIGKCIRMAKRKLNKKFKKLEKLIKIKNENFKLIEGAIK